MSTTTSEPARAPTSPRGPHRAAAALRGVGPIGIAFVVFVIVATAMYGPRVSGPLVLLWAWWTKVPWRDLGFVRPRSWPRTILGATFAGIALYLFMKAIVMRLLGFPESNPAHDFLVHNAAALPGMLLVVIFSAGFAEEIVARGFMFERLERLLGSSRTAKITTVLVTSVLFGLAHFPEQHWMGATNAFVGGLVAGTYFALRRNLWTLIVLHASFDLCGLLVIFFDLRATIAHAIFH